ncbi:MAG: aminomethyl-transferring glycine dehydrogenase subunit GcvPA [Candidatus Natronoplasma sp.]
MVEREKKEMLEFLGVDDIEQLFEDIPDKVRTGLDIPDGLTEKEVTAEVKKKLKKNRDPDELSSFLGAGVYQHFIPAAVEEIIGQSEFYTSYTPYQAEISQGMLQALFEYQSVIAELTGLGAVNTSMYDRPTALAEAVLMSGRIKREGHKFLIPENTHWDNEPVLKNYLRGKDIDIEKVEFDEKGRVDKEDLKEKMDQDVLGFYVATPNVFGVLEEDVRIFKELKEDSDSVLVVGTNPLVLSLMKPPGEWGADIVVGDSQPFGIPQAYGGPTVGIFACGESYIRKMPGRIIGETEDSEGRRAYCMTLQTREQHIRRERATSNICTNQALMALASASFAFLQGSEGLEKVAKENYEKAHQVAEKINGLDGFDAPYFQSEFFNEFTVKTSMDSQQLYKECQKENLLPGVPLDDRFSSLPEVLLTAVTEMKTEEEIDDLVDTLKEVTE